MTPEKQRIAIAEACGWYLCREFPSEGVLLDPNGIENTPPDYLSDLNAMHEAEMSIYSKAKDYCEWLDKVVGHHNELFGLTFATAAQRAEAFLKTIGKWKE